MIPGKLHDRVKIDGPAIQMHGQNAYRAAGNLLLRVLGVDGVRIIDVAENRHRSHVDHRLDAGKCSERRNKDFISRLQLSCHGLGNVQQMDGSRPRCRQDHVFYAEVSGKLLFKRLTFGAKNIVAAFDDL